MASRIGSAAAALPALTGLRGIAAVWVMLFHVQIRADALGLPSWIQTGLLSHGWIAVDVFFILSGFVLMHTHGLDSTPVGVPNLRRFALQRFLRIYPPSAAVLLLILVLTRLDPSFVAYWQRIDPASFTFGAFLKTLALTNRWFPTPGEWNEPTWSLSVEIAGYVAFPWLAQALSDIKDPRRALSAGAACVTALVWLNWVSGRTDYNDIASWAFVRMAFCFAGGACLARFRQLMAVTPFPSWSLAATVAAGALVCSCALPGLMVLAVPASAVLVLALSLGGGTVGAALSSKPAVWLGRISFPLYLVHVVPLLWLVAYNQDAHLAGAASWAAVGLYLLFCLVLAYGLHRLVEQPSHRLARRVGRTLATGGDRRLGTGVDLSGATS